MRVFPLVNSVNCSSHLALMNEFEVAIIFSPSMGLKKFSIFNRSKDKPKLIAVLSLVQCRFLRESRAERGSLSKTCGSSKREALYQVKQVREVILKYQLGGQDDDSV